MRKIKNNRELIRTFISLIISVPIIIIIWDSFSWFSLLIGTIIGGVVFVIIEAFIKIIREEKSKKWKKHEILEDSFSIYEEDMEVITAFSNKNIMFYEKKLRPKKSDYNHSFDRINLAFNRILKSEYLADEELKINILGLKNTFDLMFLDPNFDKEYKH